MDYTSQMQAFATHGMQAIEKVFNDNAEFALSINVEDATQKVVAVSRLIATSVATPKSVDDMYVILKRILGELLRRKKIAIAPYGLSAIGQEQYNRLVSLPAPPEPEVEPSGPIHEFRDVIAVCKGPIETFNKQMQDAAFRARYEAASAAGALADLG